MKGPFIVFRVIAALLFLTLIAAGGFFAYRAGVAEGISQAPQVAEAIQQAAENGQAVPPMMVHGYDAYGYGFHRHHFGFFPFGILGALFFLFLFFGFIRLLFFGRMHHYGHHHGHGPWGRHWEDGVPPMFKEWHKRAHGEAGSEESESSEEKK